MPINPPVCSSPIGTSSTSCLRKFTIHFRRPAKLKEKKNFPYKGEYGFDWLRDEYIYPIVNVLVDDTRSSYQYILNNPAPLCPKADQLRAEYQKDVKHPITPYGQDYYPAWLSIFACGVNGNANSTMHKKGIYLTLQLDEIDEIADDGTEIILKSGKPCLKVMPDKIPISNFIKAGKKTRTLGQGGPTVNYYKLESVVNITCLGDTLDEHEEIKVFAKLGQSEVEVGKLMVYQNKIIPKAKIVVVNVITDQANSVTNPKRPIASDKLEYIYKYQSFNQAMIKAEVVASQDFNLVELFLNTGDPDIKVFFENINDPDYINNKKKDPNTNKTINAANDISNRLCTLYDKYGKHRPSSKSVTIDVQADGHHNTYLLLTNLLPNGDTLGDTIGVVSQDKQTWTWGNMFVIFERGLKDDHTIVHEAGHSFSLPHIFEKSRLSPSKHLFFQGYTENYMDYSYHYSFYNKKLYYKNGEDNLPYTQTNSYLGNMYSFFKWQWDLMRNDRSIEY